MPDRHLIYTFSFSHHGRYSSYHRLAHYLRSECEVVDASLRLPGWLPPRVTHPIHWRWFQFQEHRLKRRLRRGGPRCVHYIYPENSLFHGADWKGDSKLVLSCHQPAAYLLNMRRRHPGHPFLRGFDSADCLVLLSSASLADYRALAPDKRIEVVPHGIDTEFFHPDAKVPKRPLVVTVGNWLRDYDCWAATVKHISARNPETEFAVVANPGTLDEARRKLAGVTARVRYCSGLSDTALRDLYRESSVAFVPLRHAEANNAVLEAMAMGLPLVVTDLPATREYAGQAAHYCSNANPAAIAEVLSGLLADAPHRQLSGEALRRRALGELSWPKVAQRLMSLYASLIGGK
jgi:glycosyltransferase involved in cell wall biosynthesis